MSFEPEKIYLHDPHGYFEENYSGDNTVTWSEDRIDENDYEYIRSKNVRELIKCSDEMIKILLYNDKIFHTNEMIHWQKQIEKVRAHIV